MQQRARVEAAPRADRRAVAGRRALGILKLDVVDAEVYLLPPE